jgi:cyclophilin family peptidyl-prolyl cis-trans isomerase/HEAT repeat protein
VRRWAGALGVALSLAAVRCASRPARPAEPVPLSPVTSRFASLADAEPALLSLEDRRAFDAAVLEAAASSTEDSVRARAALAAGRIGDERAAPLLRPLLTDASPPVRSEAAFAAGILGQAELASDLAPLLSDSDAGIAARAAWSLGMLGEPAGERALLAALSAASEPARRAALLRGLWRFATPDAAAAAATHAADPDPAVRAAALYTLARRPQASSLPMLTAALRDPDAGSAALCARALGILGKAESAGPLAAAIEDRRTPVAINAMVALRAVLEKDSAAAPPVVRGERLLELSGAANPNLAVPALALLRWGTSDREVFRRLWSTASTSKERRQQVALQSLMGGLGKESEALVDTAIESSDPHLRAAAAEALSFLPAEDAAGRRARLASDPAAIVRLKVLEGLASPEAARGSRALVEAALSDPDVGVRASALDALSLLDEPGTWALLREAVLESYGDREPDVPITAIGAADKRPEKPEARAVVEAAYRHPSTLVSRLARRSLVKTFRADPAQFPWREYVTGKSVTEYAALLAEAKKPWLARLETSQGAFTVLLAGADAPMTVVNFTSLARRGHFDGVRIHRVVPNYVVQDGDPTGTGNGGPGYEIRDELNAIPYGSGTVGMALSGPDTGGSQWFATQGPQPHLDGLYTVFGQVTAGMDVVNRIEQGDTIRRVTVSAGGP